MAASTMSAADASATVVVGVRTVGDGTDNGATADANIAVAAQSAANARTAAIAGGSDSAAGDLYIATADDFAAAASAARTAADAGGKLAAISGDGAASNGCLTVLTHAAADTCTAATTGSVQTASFIVVVLNGQLAAGHIPFAAYGLVVLQTSVITAALQLVAAIQLDIGIALAGHAHGGFSPATGVDVQVVESDVHVALRSIDGDCVLIRRAGDDGAGVHHILIRTL